jgi:hypothetical protein
MVYIRSFQLSSISFFSLNASRRPVQTPSGQCLFSASHKGRLPIAWRAYRSSYAFRLKKLQDSHCALAVTPKTHAFPSVQQLNQGFDNKSVQPDKNALVRSL